MGDPYSRVENMRPLVCFSLLVVVLSAPQREDPSAQAGCDPDFGWHDGAGFHEFYFLVLKEPPLIRSKKFNTRFLTFKNSICITRFAFGGTAPSTPSSP